MKFQALLLIILVFINLPKTIYAIDKFSAVIQVDDMSINQYEIDQRAKFYKILNFPGNHENEAKRALIDDRLKMRAANTLGIQLQNDKLDFEMQAFAGRANLTIAQFTDRLEKEGVARETWIDFMKVPILWFETVNEKFASEISETIYKDRSYGELETGAELEVLLTEIIIPVQPGFEDEAINQAETLSKIKSLEKFSEAAYRYSAAPTRNIGGKVNWQSLSALPSVVKPLVAGLAIGEVSEPLPIPGGIAIFQLRDLRESIYQNKTSVFIEFIEFSFNNNPKINSALESDVMVCDDLYQFSNEIKNSELNKSKIELKALSKTLRRDLDTLDENEFVLKTSDEKTTKLIMVCERNQAENLSNEEIRNINQSIANKRLYSLANSYIDNLRQEAVIIYK